jgi:hypothetical protein
MPIGSWGCYEYDVVSTTLPAATRTPDDIAFELSSYRTSIRSLMQAHAATLHARDVEMGAQSQSQSLNHRLASTALLRTIGPAQQYLQTFIRSRVTPSAVVKLISRRPMMAGLIAVAGAGAIALAGPPRLFGWAARAVAVWRAFDIFSSAIRKD